MNQKTIIIRHTRENLKKCTLSGLERNENFLFYTYPACAFSQASFANLNAYCLLDLEGEPLSVHDAGRGLILVDATWRLAKKIVTNVAGLEGVPKRSIPPGFRTAYPRRQDDCIDPSVGLASIEALYIAFFLMRRATDGLLDTYHWKDIFLEENKTHFCV